MEFYIWYALLSMKFDGFYQPARLTLKMAELDKVKVDLLCIFVTPVTIIKFVSSTGDSRIQSKTLDTFFELICTVTSPAVFFPQVNNAKWKGMLRNTRVY